MAPPSKTINDLDRERRARNSNPIGYAIKEHERKHHRGFLNILGSCGVSPSKSIPPTRGR